MEVCPETVRRLLFVVAREPERDSKFAIVFARFVFVETRVQERIPTTELRDERLLLVLTSHHDNDEIFAVTPESEVLMVIIVPERAFCALRSVK